MKNLAKNFLSPDEQRQIDEAVKAAEKETSGEIVCMIVSSSYRYPMAEVIGASVFSLPLALVLTHLIGGWLWMGTMNLWLFLVIFALLFAGFHVLIHHTAWIKRWFISKKEIEEEVEEEAVKRFFQRGLYRTRDATGILIFISVLEHKVWVLADHGINAKVSTGQWDTIVSDITYGIRQKKAGIAICESIKTMGAILKTHFPVKPDDVDELENVIIDET